MSTSSNNGGPAFPQPNHLVDTDRGREEARGWMQDSGMSLRDWFAGQFLTTAEIMGTADSNEIATACYKMADAMLAARGDK